MGSSTMIETSTDQHEHHSLLVSEMSNQHTATVDISRPAYTLAELRQASGYLKKKRTKPLTEVIVPRCSGEKLKGTILGFLPFISVLSTYQWRHWLLNDFIAGISVGVIHIPQGMGFALLTSVPAVYGLYSSFFPVVLYFFFGTSRHISFGTMAVISLLIGAVVDREMIRLEGEVLDEVNNQTTASPAFNMEATKVGIACAVSLMAGLLQILFGVCRLGVVASFMSQSFVGGFMTGAGVHIVSSQMSNMFGISLKGIGGVGKVPKVFIEVLKQILDFNLASVIITVTCTAILLGLKKGVNERFAQRMPAPVPAELVVVSLGILVSYLGDLNGRFGVNIVGDIPTGIPAPEMPLMDNASAYIGDAVMVAIISFAISISMATIFTRRHNYAIDANQEMMAYGIAHSVSAFFHCFAGAQAPPRSLVHDGVGGRTQVASLFSSVLVLIVCLVAAPIFEPLPKPVLACVIVVALFPLFNVYDQLRQLWRVNRYDLITWLVTWGTVTFVDVSTGLIVGMGVSLLTVVAQTRLAKGVALGHASGSKGGLYASYKRHGKVVCSCGVHIFSYPAPLYFANIDNFRKQLYAVTINPSSHGNDVKDVLMMKDSNGASTPGSELVILDCSAIAYLDTMGLNLLQTLRSEYAAVNVQFVLCCCSDSMLNKLKCGGIIDSNHESDIAIYPTIDDAVVSRKILINNDPCF